MTTRPDTLQGSLPLLVLNVLARRGPLHGYAITSRIHELSDDLRVEEGSLYPALQRMLIKGWIRGEWGKTEENRRARYYQLTADGSKQLARELARYERIAQAIARILQPA